jgi:hypothetical protein
MHKKGITEEVAKKRSRKNTKIQVGHFSKDERGDGWAVREDRANSRDLA